MGDSFQSKYSSKQNNNFHAGPSSFQDNLLLPQEDEGEITKDSIIGSNAIDEELLGAIRSIAAKQGMETPLADLHLSIRPYNFLRRAGFSSIGQILALSYEELAIVYGLGNNSLLEIQEKTTKYLTEFLANNPNWRDRDYEVFLGQTLATQELNGHFSPTITNRIRSEIKQLLSGDFSPIYDPELHPDERKILINVKQAINDLGIEICSLAFNEPNETIKILQAFVIYNNQLEAERIIYTLFSVIPEHRKKKPLPCFLALFNQINNTHLNLSHNYVYELDENAVTLVEQKNLSLIKRFLEWLSFDINDLHIDILPQYHKQGNRLQILAMKANGSTLDAIGKSYNITRERVRQILVSVENDFERFQHKCPLLSYYRAENNGECFITSDQIRSIVTNSESLIYLLKRKPDFGFAYDRSTDCFYVPSEIDPIMVNELITKLSEILYESDRQPLLQDLGLTNHIPTDFLNLSFSKNYIRHGTIWCNRKLTRAYMFSFILEKYFPNGIWIYDDSEIERFKIYLRDVFGEVSYSDNGRAMWGILARVSILYGRGIYIHPSHVKIPKDLLTTIESYFINSGRTSISFHELFAEFKEDLLIQANITNRYQLQGVFNHFFGDKYFSYRDGITLDKDFKIAGEIEAYVEENSPVSRNDLKEAFAGITDAMLFQNLARQPSVLLLDDGNYIHADELTITEADYDIRDIINIHIRKIPIVASKLLDYFYSLHSDFLQRNSIHSPSMLFSVLQYIFAHEFSFSRPFIASKETGDVSKIDVILMLIAGRERVNLAKLISVCEENQLAYQSTSQLLLALQKDYLQLDKNTLISIKNLDLSANKLNQIRDLLQSSTSIDGFIPIEKIDNLIFYPDVGFPWTPVLLKSIVQSSFGDEFKVINNPSDIIVDAKLGVDNYEELVRFIVKREHRREKFANSISVVKWLVEKGLVKNKALRMSESSLINLPADYQLEPRHTPKFLNDESFISTDISGELYLK